MDIPTRLLVLVPLCVLAICEIMLLLRTLPKSIPKNGFTPIYTHSDHEYQSHGGRLEPEGNNIHYYYDNFTSYIYTDIHELFIYLKVTISSYSLTPVKRNNRHLSRLTFYCGGAANRWEYHSMSVCFRMWTRGGAH